MEGSKVNRNLLVLSLLFFLLEVGVDCLDVTVRECGAAVDEDVLFSAVFVLYQQNWHA